MVGNFLSRDFNFSKILNEYSAPRDTETYPYVKENQLNQTLSTPPRHLPPEAGQLPAIPTTERLLPLPEVESRSGFKSSFIYQLIKEGKFPKPVKIGTASRWRESEIQAWIFNQIEGGTSGKNAKVRA